MALPADFVHSWTFIHPRELIDMAKAQQIPKPSIIAELYNEVRPVDLFCYLGTRFGAPNGLQNHLRRDDSDNLIHWEWTLRHASGLIWFQGMNFRTEVWISGLPSWESGEKMEFVSQIKADLGAHGPEMSKTRRKLEHWIEFVNPYQRIRSTIDRLLEDLASLELERYQGIRDSGQDLHSASNKQIWEDGAHRYSRAFGLCFAIRSLLPVLAEAFVNLLLYVLLRPEIKDDARLRDHTFRQPIDVRVKLLGVNCVGFQRQPDWASEPCSKYNSLVNERNDLLHGNVVIDKLKFNEVYFLGTVPVFQEYRSIWERSLGVTMKAVGIDRLHEEVAVVDNFIDYLTSCLEEGVRDQCRIIAQNYELGLNTSTQRLGVLFPRHLVDFKADK